GQIGGRVLFSSGVLYLAAVTGERLAVPLLLAVLAGTLALALCVRVGGGPHPEVGSRPGRRGRYLRTLLRTPRFWRLVVFALVGGLGFEAAGALSGPWLAHHGLDDAGVATFRLVTAGLMAAGAWLGGRLADRMSPSVAVRGLLAALVVMLLATAATGSVVCYALAYFGIGAFTAASYALFMANATGPLAATVFSAFMGLTNACEAMAGRAGGLLQTRFGYGAAIAGLALASLVAWPLLRRRKSAETG
ncbi:MAG: hypothetical protein KDE27_33000, partial [Planctomycetes bacterium]|nr:hypothetical protein [Planctomycetota bacterium]